MQKYNINRGRREHNKFIATFVATIMLLTTFTTLFLVAAPISGAEVAQIWTTDEFGNPKNDFAPGELVYIQGSDFVADTDIKLSMTRPDGWIEYAPDSEPIDRFPSDVLPHTDGNGDFSDYIYDLDGIVGLYTIDAGDGTSSVTFTFTDGVPMDFKQYATITDLWWGSILNKGNSDYYEGMSVPQRIIFTDVESTTDDEHTLTLAHLATSGGVHAYDWLTGWNQGNVPPLSYVPWGDDIGPQATTTMCGDLYNQTGDYDIYVDVPDDTFISKDGSTQERIDAYEAVYGNRQIRICGNEPITSASFTSIVHGDKNGNPIGNGEDTGNSYINYELTWTSASTEILIQVAGHLAMSGDNETNPIAWGIGLGSSQINGANYHFKLFELDDTALGNQDNQINGADILMQLGTIIVNKQTIPDGAPDSFTFTGDLAGSISDGEQISLGGLEPGQYTSTEIIPAGWELVSIVCDDTNSVGDVENATVIFNLEEGETINATFTNSILPGHIVVDKVTDPSHDSTLFTFDPSWGSDFELADDTTPHDSGALSPGIYTVSEIDIPAGWSLGSISITDPSGGSSAVDNTATINLSAGETVYVTFNDYIKRGKIIVDKVTDPSHDSTLFTFEPSWDSNFELADDTTPYDSGDLLPGTYYVSEIVPSGWTLTSIGIVDPTTDSTSNGNNATICLYPGETVTVTFNNYRNRSGIVVIKNTIGGNGQFNFTSTTLDPTFSITTSSGTGQRSFTNLLPGTYDVAETVPTGWDLTSTWVSDGSPISALDLNPGETIYVMFNNTKKGKIIVDKITIPSGDETQFEFNPSWGSPFFLSDESTPQDSGYLLPGEYTVTELAESGWHLKSITGATSVDGNTATVELGAGESYTVTFTNEKLGEIIVEKNTIGGDGQFNFTSATLDPTFSITTSTGYGEKAFTDLIPGTYDVAESIPTGWDLTSTWVSDGSPISALDLNPGETIYVMFNNTKKGKIIVDKITIPSGDETQFEFNPSWGSPFFLSDESTPQDSGYLLPGEYTVTELALPINWYLVDINITDPSGGSSPSGNTATIDLAPGETVTVKFTNMYSEGPDQTIEYGYPRIEGIYDAGGKLLDLIGSKTPVWINSSAGEVGSHYIIYRLYYSDHYGDWDEGPEITVWDNVFTDNMFTNDTDPTEGRISVRFYFNESCFHQIHARCYDYQGYENYSTPVDVLVDADGPSNEYFEYLGCKYLKPLPAGGYIRYISENTQKHIWANDTGCTGGAAGVCRIDWRVENCKSKPIAEGSVYDWNASLDPEAPAVVYDLYSPHVIVSVDTDPAGGLIDINISIDEDCEHYIYHQAVDCLGNTQLGKKEYNRVDVQPPRIVKTHPGHGYDPINDTDGYLKAGETIKIEAFDDQSLNTCNPSIDCNSGLQAIFFRYEFDGDNYPEEGDTGPYEVVSGAEIAATYGYDDPEIIDHWWYRIDGNIVNITWYEECQHDLYYWAKDNVCHHTDVFHQTYFVDEYSPDVQLDFPDHGYMQIDCETGRIKAFEGFYINATDMGTEECQAGIEAIFWRYEYNGVSYPDVCEGAKVISGDELVRLYGEDYNTSDVQPYCWYVVYGDSVTYHFEEDCVHNLSYFAKDNVCHRSIVKNHTFYVDDQEPWTDIIYPSHGYYRDEGRHLKCNTTFTINAYDLPDNQCMAGIETIFWRYEWNDGEYPEDGNVHGYDTIDGAELQYLYGPEYASPSIADFIWYRVNASSVDIWFEEQCYHEMYYFVKDNLCHRTEITYLDYYVDNTPPDVSIREDDLSGHGYYYNETEEKEYIKANMHFNITAIDDHECSSGIETIFFRYEFDDGYYPPDGNIYGYDTITGTELVALYGEAYNNSDIKPYTWYRINYPIAELWFEENCTHTLYYFAKDNVCNPSEVFDRTFHVDNANPNVSLCVYGHGYYYNETEEKEYLRAGKHFSLNAWDNGDCKAGIETIFFRYAVIDEAGYYTFYPPEDNVYGYDVISGLDIYYLYGEDYNYEAITDYMWYRVNASYVDVWFEEQCEHELWYFAKDNVCHRTDLETRTFYVDDEIPLISAMPDCGHGSYPTEDENVWFVRVGKEISIWATDQPDNKCGAGIESIFFRYEYNGGYYPPDGPIYGYDTITGTELVALYGEAYNNSDIKPYTWYRVNNSMARLWFEENCTHTLYYFAKDNVCHPTDVYSKTFLVDDRYPYVDMLYPSHGHYYGGGDDFFNDWDYEIPYGASAAVVTYHQGDLGTYYTPVAGGSLLELKTDGPGSYTTASNDFDMLSGEMLEGWAAFDARDYWPYEDNGAVVVRNNVGDIIATPWYCEVSMVGNYGDGPWTYWSWTAPADGVYTLEFRVANDDDSSVDSYALFDMSGNEIGKTYLRLGKNITLVANDFPGDECQSGIEGIFWRYEWNGQEFPFEGQDEGIPDGAIIVSGGYLHDAYQYTDPNLTGYYWYFFEFDMYSEYIVNINFTEECEHTLYYWSKDNVCHNSTIYNKTFFVDGSDPETDITVSGHGFYNDMQHERQYLRVGKELTINGYDYPSENDYECAAGIESIFYRYVWTDDQEVEHKFPIDAGEGIVHGSELYDLYGYEGPQYNHYWYRIDDDTAFVSFDEECEHELVWFVKDNVCHPSEILYTRFYVDDSAPEIYSETPEQHGYYYNESTEKLYMRVEKHVDLHAYDLPVDSDCAAGVEAIFWRYEWNGQEFPAQGETGEGIRSGESIAENYSYTDPAFIGYNWYTVESSEAIVYFKEECQHDLYFWAKDNVCHNSTMHHELYYVDNSSPYVEITVGEPNCSTECYDCDGWCINEDTEITLNAYDLPEDTCDSGIEGIFWRYTYKDGVYPYDEDEDMNVLNGCQYYTRSGKDIWYDYGYEDEDIILHDWYFTPCDELVLNFTEECTHVLYYWAKDNVCHHSEVYCANFSVDLTPPKKPIKTINGPHAKLENDSYGHDQWIVFPETDICFTAEDDGPHSCGPITIEYRIWYLGTWTDWMELEYTECINLQEGCVHYLEARAYDCLGNRGETDNETFWVCAPGGETGPDVTIIEPTFGSTHCERTLEVIIEASDGQTPTEDLEIIVWIPPQDSAPTLWYYPEYSEIDGKFHVFIDIYKYQDGTQLTLWALAIDEDNNVEYAQWIPFEVCSTVVYDQWMQKGWNSLTLPFGAIACSHDTEDVLSSIDGKYDYVFYYNPQTGLWDWYDYSDKTGFLTQLYTGRQYWVYVNTADRFFADTHGPTTEIMIPEDGDEYEEETGQPGVIDVYAYDLETHIANVYLEIYDQTANQYYNGGGWQSSQAWVECYFYSTDYWDYYSYGIWTAGHTYGIKARAYDAGGCYGEDNITISIAENEEPEETILTIEPASLNGEVEVTYYFTLLATNIPGGNSNVTFEWNFGDGTTGSGQAPVTGGQASIIINHTYYTASAYGLIAVVKDEGSATLADAYAAIIIGQVTAERNYTIDECGTWEDADAGGYGLTIDYWNISAIQTGCQFDISFNCYNQPDKIIVEYPIGNVVLDTGWRGSSYYQGNPLYPGGIAGPGVGEEYNIFTKGTEDIAKVTVIGGEPGTLWEYSIRSPCPT